MIAPSILNADNMYLGTAITHSINAGISEFHVDIMDGHFVPNLSYGPELVKDFKKEFLHSKIEIHLMSNNLKVTIPLFVQAGCDSLEFHVEATNNIEEWINYLHGHHVKVGLVLNPSTPVERVKPYLSKIDQVLLMTVNPGFGGQEFHADSLKKIKELVNLLQENNIDIPIEVDGGINDKTAKLAKKAGANKFVVGSFIFGNQSIEHQIELIKTATN